MRGQDERGQVTAFVVVMTTALLLMAGLVLDGGEILAAQRQATNEAEASARVGAQAIDLRAYRSGGPIQLDPTRARAGALAYLAAAGVDHRGDVTVTGDQISVTVHLAVPLRILPLGTRHVTGHGTARAEHGVTGAEP